MLPKDKAQKFIKALIIETSNKNLFKQARYSLAALIKFSRSNTARCKENLIYYFKNKFVEMRIV